MRTKNLTTNLHFMLCLIIGLFLMVTKVHAEDIKITVKERGTGVAIEGAYVVINDEQYVETTNDKGIVLIPLLENNDTIKIVASGFNDLNSIYNESKPLLKFYLYPEVVEGEGLEVTEARIQEKVSKISLTKEEILLTPGSLGDPLKVITSLPGIVEVSENSSDVYLRGSDSQDNTAWVNRSPVGYLYHFGGFHSTLNPSLIEDFNIFLGGFPVEYNDSLGGVLDVKLRTPRTDRQHFKFDISTISTSVLAEGPVGKNSEDSYFAAFRRSYIDLLFSPADATKSFGDDDPDTDKITSVPRYYDGQFLYHHKLKKGYLESYFFTASDKMGIEIIGSAKTDPEIAGQADFSQKYQTVGITLVKPWAINTDFIMPLAYYHFESKFQVGKDSVTGEAFYANSKTNTLFWQPEMQWRINKDDQLNYGIMTSINQAPVDFYLPRIPTKQEPDYNFTNETKYRINQNIYYQSVAPYIKHRKRWSKSWSTIAGLRYTDLRFKDGFKAQEISPRATVEYQLNKDALLTATWGKYIQAPSISRVIPGYGNPNLEVLKAEHRILGFQYNFNPLYSIKTEIYDKPMTNLVLSVDKQAPDNYSNEGEGRAYGMDIFFKRIAGPRRLGWLALSFSKSERTDLRTGETTLFAGDQPFALTAVWGQPFSGSWNRWDWSVKLKVHSGSLYTPITGRSRADPNAVWVAEYAELNSARTPIFYKMDLRIGKTVLFKESTLKFYIDIQNVTNRENVTGYDYGYEYQDIDNPTEEVGMSFFPFIGVEIEY